MGTLVFSHEDFRRHVTPPGHPEQVARMDAVLKGLRPLPVNWREAPLASEDEVEPPKEEPESSKPQIPPRTKSMVPSAKAKGKETTKARQKERSSLSSASGSSSCSCSSRSEGQTGRPS